MEKSELGDSTKSLHQKDSLNNVQGRLDIVKKKNDEEYQTRVQKQNWKAFKGILESCYKQVQNSEANHIWLFKIKCIKNLLPTVEILNSRKLQLYKNSLYKRCAKEKETTSHLITCEKTHIAFGKIEKEVWEQLYKDKRREEGWDLIKLQQAMQYDHEKKYQKRKEWIRGILSKEDAEKIQTIVSSERMMIKF